MKAAGAKISTLPDEERARWAKAMPDLAGRWIAEQEKKGVKDAKQIVKDYMAAMVAGGAKPMRDWAAGL